MTNTTLSIEAFLGEPQGAEIENRVPRKSERRDLVLTDERARHPFRASLPPRVRDELHEIPAESLWRLTTQDVRGIASTYFATFAAVLVFIM